MSERPFPELERRMIDTIRVLAMDAVQKAESGHPGTPMALAPLGYVTWTRHLRHNPANPGWMDRDRFVLSAGHASMLLYSLLHLTGYDLELEDLKDFRQWESRTPGHPECFMTPGVETTTGPLGQGVANSVGMAMAERWLAARFNRPGHEVVDHHTYAVCSDGDLMEGISHEAADLAGHHGLGKLIWVWDDNRITIEGRTDLALSTDQAKRFEGYGWHVLRVDDGNDVDALDRALSEAREQTDRPTLIILRTIIAWGSPNKADTHGAHGAPLGEDEIRATKENLGYPSTDPFWVDPEALDAWRRTRERGERLEAAWRERFEAYRAEHPQLAAELERSMSGELPAGWDADVPDLSGKDDATRSSSGKVLQALAGRIPELVGGSADLGSSNKTDLDAFDSFLPDSPEGRTLHFGVREHGMGGILNGMAYHGGVRPFGGTFLIFSDYMRPSIRLAALSGLAVTWVFTHDSIGLGEDGPTHQPVEHLMALRAIPNLVDLRPGDPAETAVAWKVAMERHGGPSFLALTRQKVPALDRRAMASAEGLRRGGYVLVDASDGRPEVLLMASGSELHIAVDARALLESEGVPTRVVSLPSWALFQAQDAGYRDEVLPSDVRARVSVEAGVTLGWERWLGGHGRAVGLDRFGASAPWEVLYERFGFTAGRVAEEARLALDGLRAGAVRS
ncbi:MAG: transketolase [Gemmatimonadetes bacterium]|nr:transketolase [Gemmatimonadota bacterium]